MQAIDGLLKLKPNEISIENMQNFLNLQIFPIENLKHISKHEAAVFICPYVFVNDEIKETGMAIYLPELSRKDKIGKTLFLMHLGHGYTLCFFVKT